MATEEVIANVKQMESNIFDNLAAIRAEMEPKLLVLQTGVEKYNEMIRNYDTNKFTVQLFHEYLICLVGDIQSTKFTLTWMFKQIQLSKTTGYRKSKALKKKLKELNFTYAQYLSTIDNEMSPILSQIKIGNVNESNAELQSANQDLGQLNEKLAQLSTMVENEAAKTLIAECESAAKQAQNKISASLSPQKSQ